MRVKKQIAYARKVLPAATWRALKAPVRGPVHLIIALADHFEPGIVPEDGQKHAPRAEQERRLEWWLREYPKVVERWRDRDGRPLIHTYFSPAEQYDEGLLAMLADHCHSGWGEIEIHLHHGIPRPDTAENTRRTLAEFRDRLAFRHRCLASEEGSAMPRYAFVHGNFALANSAGGRFCGVDSEMQILAETGCYADMTLPTGFWHPAQTEKINSVYECGLPLDQCAPHRKGNDLAVGRKPTIFPLIVQAVLVAAPAMSGMRHGIQTTGLRRPYRTILLTAAVLTIAMMMLQMPGFVLLLNAYGWQWIWRSRQLMRVMQFVAYWPALYLLAIAVRHRWQRNVVVP